ncbi:MAG: hypothetical protein HYX51_00505 [Chloroflexi bacterium]|nr:hypothetical protein [Chloroflexota bacterium]
MSSVIPYEAQAFDIVQVIQAVNVYLALAVLLVNLVVDPGYSALDPRIRIVR